MNKYEGVAGGGGGVRKEMYLKPWWGFAAPVKFTHVKQCDQRMHCVQTKLKHVF